MVSKVLFKLSAVEWMVRGNQSLKILIFSILQTRVLMSVKQRPGLEYKALAQKLVL